MKTPLFLTLILASGILLSCKSPMKTAQSEPNMIMEDHVSAKYIFPEGEYFTYRFPADTPYDFDESAIMTSLSEAGIRPLNVWYKSGSSMCVPPGSDIGMTVIVEPSLLVRLAKTNDKMESLGFRHTDEPGLGSCAYRVRNYQYGKQ